MTHMYNGTIFNHSRVPSGGMEFERSGMTELSRITGKVRLECPVCGISFERYACWVKRKKVCYCSKACGDEAKRRPVEVRCVVCSATIVSTPSMVAKGVSTCSNACMRIHRRELTKQGVLLPAWRRMPGRAEGNGKLTAQQAQEISTSKESTCVLALRFGVSGTTVRNIRRKKRKADAIFANALEEIKDGTNKS